MKAMLLRRLTNLEQDRSPLALEEVPDLTPEADEILVRVSVCGVCHTELDEIEGRTAPPRLPVVLGHQVVGRIEGRGEEAHALGWKPVVEVLRSLAPGGRLVINAIRKENTDRDYLLKLDYPAHLWLEKEIKSVANVTRRDVAEFLQLAAEIPIRPEVEEFPLEDANRALYELKVRKTRGAKVLRTG